MWPAAVGDRGVPRRRGRARADYEQHTLRLFGIPESEIAETLRVAEARVEGFDDLEITTCLRRAEVEVVTRWEPRAQAAWDAVRDADRASAMRTRSSRPTGRRSTSRWPGCWRAAGSRLAESCTGGLMAARLTERPGSSEYFAGGVVVATRTRPSATCSGVDAGADRAARGGVAGGGGGDGGRGAGALRGRHGGRDHRRGRARAGGPRRSRSATCAGRSSRPTAGRWCATRACPATGPRSATARRRSAMHLLRRLLRGEDFDL